MLCFNGTGVKMKWEQKIKEVNVMKKLFLTALCLLLVLFSACAPDEEKTNTSVQASDVIESSVAESANSEESNDESKDADPLIGTSVTIVDHSKIVEGVVVKETTEYSNGAVVVYSHRYYDEALKKIESVTIDVFKDGYQVYESYEYFKANGELEKKLYSSYEDGLCVEAVECNFSNPYQTIIYTEEGQVQQHFYAKDIDTFQIKLIDGSEFQQKTYINGEMVEYVTSYIKDGVLCRDTYGKGMKLLEKSHSGKEDNCWKEFYLDDGRVFRVTEESENGFAWSVLWVYTDDASRMKRITDFNMESHAYEMSYIKPAHGVTEDEAEAHLNEYMDFLKEIKQAELLWYAEFYGEETTE